MSNTLDGRFCIECLESALQKYGAPEIFNTDQGYQFTATEFTDLLKEHGIQISMDSGGRALDNIFVERLWRSLKHKDIYLQCYTNVPGLMLGLFKYFIFYNTERPHQALGYRTLAGVDGGARIVDKFREKQWSLGVESGRCRAAA